MVKKIPFTTSSQENTLQEVDMPLSKSTIKRRLHENKYRGFTTRCKQVSCRKPCKASQRWKPRLWWCLWVSDLRQSLLAKGSQLNIKIEYFIHDYIYLSNYNCAPENGGLCIKVVVIPKPLCYIFVQPLELKLKVCASISSWHWHTEPTLWKLCQCLYIYIYGLKCILTLKCFLSHWFVIS